MKLLFIKALQTLALKDKDIVFFTGDVGYHALEGYQEALQKRFINAGIAEQNMVTVAAGMARLGLKPWVYSIASFISLKTIEQVRNDICHHSLNVKLVGNGGGYGYGILGPSHHILEDLAIFLSIPAMKVYVPAFNEDVSKIVHQMNSENNPSYLRLGLAPDTKVKLNSYSGIRNIKQGNKLTVVVLGPLVHNVLDAIGMLKHSGNIDLWVITELPVIFPDALTKSLKRTKNLLVIEEHTRVGGLGDRIASDLLIPNKIVLQTYNHFYANGYPSHTYGSQQFHWFENKLDTKSIHAFLQTLTGTHE